MRKLLLFFFALLTGVSGAWATTTVTVGPSSGTYHKGWTEAALGTGAWGAYWKSTAKVGSSNDLLRFNGVSGMNTTNGDIYSNQTYTLTAASGWVIASYTFNGTAVGDDITITPAGGSGTTITTGNSLGIALSVDVNANSTTFELSSSGDAHFTELSLNVTLAKSSPDFVEGKTFTLQCKRGYVYYNGEKLAGTATAGDASKFAYVEYEGNTYLYDVTQSAFVCHSTAARAGTSGNSAVESNSDFSKIAKGFSLGSTGIGTYPYYVEETQFGNWLNMDASPVVFLNTWTNFESGNGGNTYAIEIVDDTFDATAAIALLDEYFHPSATVTYVISDASGVIFTSEAIPATIASTITELPSDYQLPYCTYSVTSTTIDAGNNNVPVTLTSYTPPFTVSSDFATATWYYATLRGKYIRADETHKDGSGRYQTNSHNGKAQVYKWAFVGNPYNLTIMNKDAGDTKVLYAGSVPTMQVVADPSSDKKAHWIASVNSTGGFSIRSESGSTMYLNDASSAGNLGYWNSSWGANDAGSNWVITPVATGSDQFNADITQLQAMDFGTGLNQYSLVGEGLDGYTSSANGMVDGLETAGYSQDNLDMTQELIANSSLNIPATGKFYRIQGYSNNYITSNTAGSNASMNGTASANNIVYYSTEKNLVFFGSGYGLYNTSIVAPVGSTLNTYTFMQGAQIGKYYVQSNYSGGGTYCYDNTSNGTKVDRNGSPVTSGSYQTDWTLTEVTTLPVTISEAKYATLYAPVNLVVPAGVTAFWGDNSTTGDDAIVLHAINSGSVIPANNGVILYAPSPAVDPYPFVITDEDASISGNVIEGTVVTKARTDEYTLQDGTEGIAFYADAVTNLQGFKAYLPAGSSYVKNIVLDNETVVKAIEAAMNPGKAVYDMNGRRVENPTKGLYIVNGKKIIVK